MARVFSFIKKIVPYFLIMALINSVVFAQTDSMDSLKDLLSKKDVSGVNELLASSESEEKGFLEEKVLSEVQKAVKTEDLDYASSLTEAVLMNNFDNTEAQRMYNAIEKAKKLKAERLAKEEEARAAREAEEERKREIEQFYADKAEAEEKKQNYIKSVMSLNRYNFPVYAGVTPLALDFAKSPFADEYNNNDRLNVRYGAGVKVDATFDHPYVIANIRGNYDYFFAPLSGDGTKSDLRLRLSVATPFISKYFFLSFGYVNFTTPESAECALFKEVSAPVIGLGVSQLKIGQSLQLGLFADLNFLTFSSSDIDLAFDADFYIRYFLPVKIADVMKLYVENDTSFTCLRSANDNEWYCDTSFSVGAAFNVK